MGSRIQPVALGASPDAEVNRRLEEAKEGWWKDTEMFGVIGIVPDLLKSIVPVFESFFMKGFVLDSGRANPIDLGGKSVDTVWLKHQSI